MARHARSVVGHGEQTPMRWWKAALLAAGLGLALSGGGTAASTHTGSSGNKSAAAKGSVFTGYAFDACNAPSTDALSAWLQSPYRALGIYIGGVNRACSNGRLSADWAAAAVSTGWSLIPLYVGLQAPCVGGRGLAKISPTIAASQGTAAADDAAGDAAALGLSPGSPIYLDMEGYDKNDPPCTTAVQAFVSSWVDELHAVGYLAGVYGSAASTIRDLQALAATASAPDDIWIGDWNGQESVFGSAYVSDTLWTNHQRLHQYRGGHHETWGGVTIDVDSNFVDAAVVGSVNAQPITPAPPATPNPVQSAAGSVTASDGIASVTWPLGAFTQSVVVSLTPAVPSTPPDGFGSGGYGVQLQVRQTVTGSPTGMAAPVTIHIPPRAGNLAPMASSDGQTWHPLAALFSGQLPSGTTAGYTRNPNGSFDIQTTESGFYALLPEVTPPPAPAALQGHFAQGQLVLSWPKSLAVSGPAVFYQVTLHNKPLLAIPGQTTAAVGQVHHAGPSVFRVIATDAAGKKSAPSKPLVVMPTRRPAKLPKIIPDWAFALSNWQQSGHSGTRPKAPRIVPDWYWRWQSWYVAPFRIRA